MQERTEMITGVENTVRVSLECFTRVRKRHDSCGDMTLPSVIIATEPVKDAYIQLKKKGVRTRFITEITMENIGYCKALMKIVTELRHLSSLKGNFAVGERDYVASAKHREAEPIPKIIHSNVKGIIEQQQYFFETLWDKAIPAEQRIREIEEGVEPGKTQVIYGAENVVRKNIECFSKAMKKLDVCHDSTGPSVVVSMKPILRAAADFVKRGGKIRFLTEITEKNIDHCKKLMETCEARHLDGVKGNFGVSEKDYLAMPNLEEGNILPHVIHSNIIGIIRQHQYLFDTIWNKAIPAEQRMAEIEKGIRPEIIETIRDPAEIQRRGFELIRAANNEILVILSTANAFRRQQKLGTIRQLTEIAKSPHERVKVRIMTPVDENVRSIVQEIKKERNNVEVRYIEQPLQTKVSVLIIDRLYLLTVELKNDLKKTSKMAIGLATYSNSKATVLSYASIFESLWNQAELYEHIRFLYEQLKVHDKMQQEFIDTAAHELRTPIQPILGLAQTLQEQVYDSRQLKLLEAIIRNARRLNRLQEDILDVTRIESNLLRIDRVEFNLNRAIIQIVEDFNNQLHDKKTVKLIYKSASRENIIVRADMNRIIQVISNLLINAIKFTKEGRIYLDAKKINSNRQVMITIRDEGAGVDPEIIPKLFTKFASKSEKGTGLGLYISKSIVEAHGGKIWADNNKDGKGATFMFTLPLTS
jgi:two-component system sensor histidine kinase VicK